MFEYSNCLIITIYTLIEEIVETFEVLFKVFKLFKENDPGVPIKEGADYDLVAVHEIHRCREQENNRQGVPTDVSTYRVVIEEQ